MMQQPDGAAVELVPGRAVQTLPATLAVGSQPVPADLALSAAAAADEPKEACGVFGVYLPQEQVARLTFYGLFALQHRGQESAGIATADHGSLHVRTGMGLVAQVFEEEDLAHLPGNLGIGHTRYSTTGSSRIANAQPIHIIGPRGEIALAHNGNLVNAHILRRQLEEQGHELTTSTDSEIIARML